MTGAVTAAVTAAITASTKMTTTTMTTTMTTLTTTATATATATTMTTTATATAMVAAAADGRADGVVWGRRQAAKAAEMGINRKWEQCGYNSQHFIGKLLRELQYSSIGHPPHSSASPVELRLRVGPHAL